MFLNKKYKQVFFFIIYALPFVAYLVYCFKSPLPFSDFFSQFVPQIDIISETLNKLLGIDGVLPLGSASYVVPIASYFFSVFTMQLLVGFLTFLPEFLYDFMDRRLSK